jgi:hypothetical protein
MGGFELGSPGSGYGQGMCFVNTVMNLDVI